MNVEENEVNHENLIDLIKDKIPPLESFSLNEIICHLIQGISVVIVDSVNPIITNLNIAHKRIDELEELTFILQERISKQGIE